MKSVISVVTISAALLAGPWAWALEPIAVQSAAEDTGRMRVAAETPALEPLADVEVLKHSWEAGPVASDILGKGQFVWEAEVKNNATQPRKICVQYRLLDAQKQLLATSQRCEVVSAGGQARIVGNAFLDLQMLQQAKNSNAIAVESHQLYSPGVPQG